MHCPTPSYEVGFLKEGQIKVGPGQNILNAAVDAGIPIFHVCGGKSKCSTCRVLVVNGAENLSLPKQKEMQLNHQMNFPANVRLACQTKVMRKGVRLRRIIHHETDIGLYVGATAGHATQQIGVEQELILFFLDIRNFTPFMETLPAFDAIHIIIKLFLIFQKIIEDHNGRIIETAGDGIYAVFECSHDKSKSAESAVQSAFSILSDLANLNETYFHKYFNQTIQAGIGIHSGKVIIGNVRIGKEDRTIVMGYPVNIASRLQDATKKLHNDFVVSSQIFNSLPQQYKNHPKTSVNLKGIPGEFEVYLLGNPFKIKK